MEIRIKSILINNLADQKILETLAHRINTSDEHYPEDDKELLEIIENIYEYMGTILGRNGGIIHE